MTFNKKARRHSGRITPRCYGLRKEILIEEGIEPLPIWDDWKDYRDGFRGCDDRKSLRSKYMWGARYLNVKRWNKKLLKLILRRKDRKRKAKYLNRSKINLIYANRNNENEFTRPDCNSFRNEERHKRRRQINCY